MQCVHQAEVLGASRGGALSFLGAGSVSSWQDQVDEKGIWQVSGFPGEDAPRPGCVRGVQKSERRGRRLSEAWRSLGWCAGCSRPWILGASRSGIGREPLPGQG